MRIGIVYGREHFAVDVPDGHVVPVRRQPAAPFLADPIAAMHEALETPIGFPALRRALTPDDHVAIVVDEKLPRLAGLLTALLEHITQAGVQPPAITLVCPPGVSEQPWVDDLPDAFEEIRLEVHDPTDRKRLAYLATTRHNRRVYLNRTVVDADQVVILSGRGYDPMLGYSGAEASLYPALSDEATRQAASGHISMRPPGKEAWRLEAVEVAWLLGGAAFLVQIIEGADSEILHVLGGPVETSGEGQRLLDARWRVEVDRPADVVVAGISGDPTHQGLSDLAHALGCASRVVKPRGRIVLLSDIDPALDETAEPLRRAESPEAALKFLHNHPTPDMEAAFQWASAADQATLYLLSKLPGETAEELFAVPMDHAGQVKRLLETSRACVFLPDAQKTMAVLRE